MRKYGWLPEMGKQAEISPEDKAIVEQDLVALLKVESWAQARRIILERTEKPLIPEVREKLTEAARLLR